jgi:ribosome-binding protein aMBF1 (putative translation factor)
MFMRTYTAIGNFLFFAFTFRLSKGMADSRYWRRPGRRDEERARFNRLMLELERVRIREGFSKAELARRLKTTKDVIYDWLNGKMIGRKASVERIEEFLREEAAERI